MTHISHCWPLPIINLYIHSGEDAEDSAGEEAGTGDEGDPHFNTLRLLTFCKFGPFANKPSSVFDGELVNGKSEKDSATVDEEKAPGREQHGFGRRTQKKIDKLRRKRGRQQRDKDSDDGSDSEVELVSSAKQLKLAMQREHIESKYKNDMQAYMIQKENLKDMIEFAATPGEKDTATQSYVKFCQNLSLLPKRLDLE